MALTTVIKFRHTTKLLRLQASSCAGSDSQCCYPDAGQGSAGYPSRGRLRGAPTIRAMQKSCRTMPQPRSLPPPSSWRSARNPSTIPSVTLKQLLMALSSSCIRTNVMGQPQQMTGQLRPRPILRPASSRWHGKGWEAGCPGWPGSCSRQPTWTTTLPALPIPPAIVGPRNGTRAVLAGHHSGLVHHGASDAGYWRCHQ